MANVKLLYDFHELPMTPFHIYFLEDGQIQPKKIFTATKKRVNSQSARVELYILELARYIGYKKEHVLVALLFSVN